MFENSQIAIALLSHIFGYLIWAQVQVKQEYRELG